MKGSNEVLAREGIDTQIMATVECKQCTFVAMRY